MSATSFPTTLSTLPALWAWRVATTPSLPAYQRFDNARQTWQTLSWAEADAQVQRWVRALSVEPLAHGARVAILLPNGLDHVCIDQAAMARGCVPVPLHALDNPGSIAYILADAAVSVLLVERLSQWQAIRMTGTLLPALKRVVVMEPYADQDDEDKRVRLLSTWLEQPESAAVPALPTEPPTADDLATIVYTSGTTGKPKGVMLTHRNVVANVKAVLEHIVTRADDVYLSFLPLSHTFERTAGYYVPVAAGSCVAYARSVPQLAEDLLTVRPTVLVSVPRIYERVFAALQQKVEGSALKSGLMAWAQAVGWRRFRAAQGLPLAPEDRSAWAWADSLVWPLLDRAVGAQLRARFGGRLRVAVSGGAALSGAIARCFLGLGVPVLQGYGMTETSPVVAANQPERNDPATVGSALPGVEVMLAPDGELLVRGPSVMKGYWNRPEDTARVLQADGWLHTGDLASLEGGRVRIRGRLKEIIVTSTGEKIPPADLELAITADPLFEQAWVMGENRPFLTAFLVLNRVQWQHCAESLGVDAQPASLQLPAVRDALLQRVVKQVANFPRHGVPKAVWPTLDPWTLDNSLMTPTLKLKRHNLAQHFEHEIEQVYAPK